MHYVGSNVYILTYAYSKVTSLSCMLAVINQHLQVDIITNACMILIHKFYICSFNSMDVMASMMFTYFCLKFIAMPCLHVYKYLMLMFLSGRMKALCHVWTCPV